MRMPLRTRCQASELTEKQHAISEMYSPLHSSSAELPSWKRQNEPSPLPVRKSKRAETH